MSLFVTESVYNRVSKKLAWQCKVETSNNSYFGLFCNKKDIVVDTHLVDRERNNESASGCENFDGLSARTMSELLLHGVKRNLMLKGIMRVYYDSEDEPQYYDIGEDIGDMEREDELSFFFLSTKRLTDFEGRSVNMIIKKRGKSKCTY